MFFERPATSGVVAQSYLVSGCYNNLDTRTLTNGLHTIAWVVRDSAGNAKGIGSRYFTVQNP